MSFVCLTWANQVEWSGEKKVLRDILGAIHLMSTPLQLFQGPTNMVQGVCNGWLACNTVVCEDFLPGYICSVVGTAIPQGNG